MLASLIGPPGVVCPACPLHNISNGNENHTSQRHSAPFSSGVRCRTAHSTYETTTEPSANSAWSQCDRPHARRPAVWAPPGPRIGEKQAQKSREQRQETLGWASASSEGSDGSGARKIQHFRLLAVVAWAGAKVGRPAFEPTIKTRSPLLLPNWRSFPQNFHPEQSPTNLPTFQPNSTPDLSHSTRFLHFAWARCRLPPRLITSASTPHDPPFWLPPALSQQATEHRHRHWTCSSFQGYSVVALHGSVFLCVASSSSAQGFSLFFSATQGFLAHGSPRCRLEPDSSICLVALACPQECLPWLYPGLRPCLATITLIWTTCTPLRGILLCFLFMLPGGLFCFLRLDQVVFKTNRQPS